MWWMAWKTSSLAKVTCTFIILHGHLAGTAPEEDHHRVIATALRLPADWKRPVGRPRTTWLRTIDDDLQSLNFGVHTAWRKARDWRRKKRISTHFCTPICLCVELNAQRSLLGTIMHAVKSSYNNCRLKNFYVSELRICHAVLETSPLTHVYFCSKLKLGENVICMQYVQSVSSLSILFCCFLPLWWIKIYIICLCITCMIIWRAWTSRIIHCCYNRYVLADLWFVACILVFVSFVVFLICFLYLVVFYCRLFVAK